MNIEDLEESARERIISSGIELMSAITDGFGAEEGIKIWDDLSSCFGDSIKYAVFTAMLSGQTSGVVTLTLDSKLVESGNLQIVSIIKCIRNYTGLGLKDSKDITDALCEGRHKQLKVDHTKRRYFVTELRTLGVTVL